MERLAVFDQNLLSVESTIEDVFIRLDKVAVKIILVIDDNGKLVGTVTDGDIRRALIVHRPLNTLVVEIMNVNPRTVNADFDEDEIYNNYIANNICRDLPILDDNGRVIGLTTWQHHSHRNRTNPVVIMAGGLGTRLRPLTDHTPKPLLEVGGRPILEGIIERLRDQGLKDIHLSINHMGEQFKDFFGDGSNHGVHISYIEEDKPLGTCGALKQVQDKSDLPLIVMNGDVLTNINFSYLLDYHENHQSSATVCLRNYSLNVPYGVVDVCEDSHKVTGVREKPTFRFFVSAGLYVLSPHVLDLIPDNSHYDMPTLLNAIEQKGMDVGGFPLKEYWLDIGQMEEFERAQKEYHGIFGVNDSHAAHAPGKG